MGSMSDELRSGLLPGTQWGKRPEKLASINRDYENSYKFNIIILTFYKYILNQINYINFNLQRKFSVSDAEIQYLN